MRQRTAIALTVAITLLAACSDDEGSGTATTAATIATETTTAPTTADSTDSTGTSETTDATDDPLAVVAGQPFPPARCEANRAAGTITYLSGFDFAAAASIVDVIVAEQEGYFDELCLDVELQPSSSTANYPLIADSEAQFASGGSFSEVVTYAEANEADLVAVAVEGRTAIDRLIVKPGTAATLEDLAGQTIGVKFALPPSIAAMLATAGLAEGEDYETVLLDGFDPEVHYGLDGIVGFPGYASNEPGALDRAGLEFELFDPAEFDVPGSFGIIYTTQSFIDEHPTAAQDFVRATMRGLAEAVDDPEAAAATALELVEANGNPAFLSPEGEAFRWDTDAASIAAAAAEGGALAVPDPDLLQAEVAAYAEVGLFDGEVPDLTGRYDVELIEGVYDDNDRVIWP
ncbi:MAG: ABC transporter substrate-binding protein [Ilumatobacteraceae bacterium]